MGTNFFYDKHANFLQDSCIIRRKWCYLVYLKTFLEQWKETLPWPPTPLDDTLPQVFVCPSCLFCWVCDCPVFCDCCCWPCCVCCWTCGTGWAQDGVADGRCGSNCGCWIDGAFCCDVVELEAEDAGVTEGVSWSFSFVLPHPPPPLGTRETVGSLPEFSLFRDGRLAGGGTRRVEPIFPRLCNPWRAGP